MMRGELACHRDRPGWPAQSVGRERCDVDYGYLIRESWRLTWRHRFLWVLGLFASSSVGSCSPSFNYQFGPSDFGESEPEIRQTLEQIAVWIGQNLELVFLAVGILLLLVLVLIVLSLIAQGGMATATADLARGRLVTSGQAWSIGLRLAWRYLVMWLILLGLLIVVFLVFAAVLGLLFLVGSNASGGGQALLIAFGVLLVLVMIPAGIAIAIAASIAGAFAQRAIAVEDAGPLAALERGVGLLRGRLGTSLLAWLVSLGLGIGAAIAVGIGVVVLLIPLGIVGFVLFSAAGLSAATIIYLALAALVLIAGSWLMSGIANTFFWSYWTLVYLNLTGQLPVPAAQTPEPPAA